ncbi:NDR1/HIN1-like protein 10 [Vigna unguiculata]|uniref:NDR1/HIN1-like protein 10 n=1 Tax=Vigna unguiculata TaxID=3917 RepID=UPI0010169F07|nr:NDR1/HIN1-like protein 10 [Vigna unguiculata]
MAHPTSQTGEGSKRKGSNLLRYLAMVILALIIVVGIAVIIVWLVVKPKTLEYSVENAAIHNFNLTDANHLYANFDFTIRSYNPNSRVSIYYDTVEVSVRYEDQTLATNAVQPFFQAHKNVTRLHVGLTAQTVALYESVPKDLKLEKSSGDIELDVLVRARIRFKVGSWKSKHRVLRIFCSPVLVHFSKAKSFQRVPCEVEL